MIRPRDAFLAGLFFAAPAFALAPAPQTFVVDHGGHSALTASGAVALDLNADFTVECWLHYEERVAGRSAFGIAFDNGGVQSALDFRLGGQAVPQPTLVYGNAGGSQALTAPDPIPLHEWHHVAVRRSGATLALLVDANVVASGASVTFPTTGLLPWAFGGLATSAQLGNFDGMQGSMRRARLWQRALSDAEIAVVAATPPAAGAIGLVADWPMDEGGGAVASNHVAGSPSLIFGSVVALDSFDPRWRHTAVVDAGPFFESTPAIEVVDPNSALRASIYSPLLDLGHDGFPDVLVLRGSLPGAKAYSAVARNIGGVLADGTTAVLGNTDAWMRTPRWSVIADFDGDGRDDAFLVESGYDHGFGPGGQSRLLLQQPDGSLRDVTDTHLPIQSLFGHGGCAGDLDGDGDLDLGLASLGGGRATLPGRLSGSRALFNDGSGHFVDLHRMPWDGVPQDDPGRFTHNGCTMLDANQDGKMDMVWGASEGDPDLLLINDGTGHFTVANLPPRPSLGTTQNLGHGDLDGDGRDDIFGWQTGTAEQPVERFLFLRNLGGGTFKDLSARIPPNPQRGAVGFLVDIDGDGDLDVISASGDRTAGAVVTLNLGGCRFVDASEFVPGANTLVQPADMDADGAIDLVQLTDNLGGVRWRRQVKPIDSRLLDPNGPIYGDGFEDPVSACN